MLSWSCSSFILASSFTFCFLFDRFELLILSILKKFVKLGNLSLLVWYYFLFFLKSFLVGKVFLSNVFEFLKLSFGLSIKSTHEIELSKVTWSNRTEEFGKKQKFLVLNGKWFFCLFTFNSRADIITRYNFDQVRCFFIFNIDFMV